MSTILIKSANFPIFEYLRTLPTGFIIAEVRTRFRRQLFFKNDWLLDLTAMPAFRWVITGESVLTNGMVANKLFATSALKLSLSENCYRLAAF